MPPPADGTGLPSSLPGAATDTIAAIATASGAAGIGIVRISGPNAFQIADRLLLPERRSLSTRAGHTLRRDTIHDVATGDLIDDALIAIFHAPRSFTGENVVEIQGHGGAVTLKRVFSSCLAADARPARPGEFSERAFVNGKMDLAQAEAVADLVNAETIGAQRAALRQVTGALSKQVHLAAQQLKAALAAIEASIDFPEDVGDIDPVAVAAKLTDGLAPISALLGTATYGRRLREGLSVVLTGRPNVGKSSLLNALSGTDRAIVTDVPGTTRDIIEEVLHIHGIPVRALDTAGLRESADPVERIGVERARAAVAAADVTVLVLDAASGLDKEDVALLKSLDMSSLVVALNKADLTADISGRIGEIREIASEPFAVVPTSTKTREGLEALTRAIAQAAGDSGEIGSAAQMAPIVTSARHEQALRAASDAIMLAHATISDGLSAELIAVDIHAALQFLGEITGETAREDIIAGIFATFCIGK